MFESWRFHFTISFQLCCTKCPNEGSGKRERLKIRWHTSALVYAEDVNILGGNERTMKKNTENLVVASNEIGPEVNGDKTK